MPDVIPPTLDSLIEQARAELEPLGLTWWGEGSRVGALVRTQAQYAADLWQGVAAAAENLSLSTARGIYLDQFAESFGVRRLPAQAAGTLGLGQAVKFTNTGGSSVTVPAHTRIWNPAQVEVAFFTNEAVTLAGGAEGYVHVTAGQTGERYNLGANTLTAHNAGLGQVTVTNVRPVGGGALAESDASLRYRVSQALLARSGGTETAIRQAVLQVPGVRDALLYPGVRGAGSLDILIVPVDREATAALLQSCELAVTETVAAGVSWRVKAPVTRRVDARIRLRLTPGAAIADVAVLVESGVRGYLDNLAVNTGQGGAELIWNELVSRVQDSSPDIVDSDLQLTLDGTPVLQTNLTPGPGERLVSGSVGVS